tara:strand:- start:586 stop:1023 length:438 start_codon:yes stop_codon:yes gene_type:complete
MNIIGLDHRGIRTKKLEASRHFYEDLLGLSKGYRPKALGTKGYWLYAGDTPVIHLIEAPHDSVDDNTVRQDQLETAAGQTHIALATQGAREAVLRLSNAGVPYWDRLFKDPVMYQVFAEDPDGFLVELIDRTPGEIDGPICKIVG